jgi:hypothetical protein
VTCPIQQQHVSPRDILTPLRSVAMSRVHNVARQPRVADSVLALAQSTVGPGQHAATPRSESKRDSSELSEICRCAKSLLRVTRLSTQKRLYINLCSTFSLPAEFVAHAKHISPGDCTAVKRL